LKGASLQRSAERIKGFLAFLISSQRAIVGQEDAGNRERTLLANAASFQALCHPHGTMEKLFCSLLLLRGNEIFG
jgi:hypothetical protein